VAGFVSPRSRRKTRREKEGSGEVRGSGPSAALPCEGCDKKVPLGEDLIILSEMGDQTYWHRQCRLNYLTKSEKRRS